jgi:hypothetical protein
VRIVRLQMFRLKQHLRATAHRIDDSLYLQVLCASATRSAYRPPCSPLVITNSVTTRPLTVGLTIFAAPESCVNWSIISAGTLMTVAPLLIAFLLFQRHFVQSFMRAGIR